MARPSMDPDSANYSNDDWTWGLDPREREEETVSSNTIENSIGATAFEEMLDNAEEHARGEREQEFVGDLRENYLRYGGQMFLSPKQYEWLEKIAERES